MNSSTGMHTVTTKLSVLYNRSTVVFEYSTVSYCMNMISFSIKKQNIYGVCMGSISVLSIIQTGYKNKTERSPEYRLNHTTTVL